MKDRGLFQPGRSFFPPCKVMLRAHMSATQAWGVCLSPHSRPAGSRLALVRGVWVPDCWPSAVFPVETQSCGSRRRCYGDAARIQGFSCTWVVPGWGGRSLNCAHLGTGLMHLTCPEHLSRCLLLLPPLALQHLEKGAGGPCWGAGDLQAWQSSRDKSHPHCLRPPRPSRQPPAPALSSRQGS